MQGHAARSPGPGQRQNTGSGYESAGSSAAGAAARGQSPAPGMGAVPSALSAASIAHSVTPSTSLGGRGALGPGGSMTLPPNHALSKTRMGGSLALPPAQQGAAVRQRSLVADRPQAQALSGQPSPIGSVSGSSAAGQLNRLSQGQPSSGGATPLMQPSSPMPATNAQFPHASAPGRSVGVMATPTSMRGAAGQSPSLIKPPGAAPVLQRMPPGVPSVGTAGGLGAAVWHPMR